MGGGGKRWFDLFYVVITLICLAVLAFIFFAGPAMASASLVPWSDLDHDPADFSPVLSDGSDSLPGFESREAEGLAVSSETDQQQEETVQGEQVDREAEGLAVSSETDQQQEETVQGEQVDREAEGLAVSSETDDQEEEETEPDSREAEGLVLSEEVVDDDGETILDPVLDSSPALAGIASDVSAIRGILEISTYESMEAEAEIDENEPKQELDVLSASDSDDSVSPDPGDSSVSSSSDISADSSSGVATETDIVSLETIHTDLWLILFTLWGFFGMFLAFKLGGVVLGRL